MKILFTDSAMRLLRKNLFTTDEILMLAHKVRHQTEVMSEKTCGKHYWFEMNGRWADIPADLVTEL